MRVSWSRALLSVVSLLTACGAPPARAPIGSTYQPAAPDTPPEAAPAKAAVPDDIVARSAQPFRAQRNADGLALDQAQLLSELSKFDVVCLGEAHDAPRDHFAELAISEGLEKRARVSGRALGIGFEMFQAPYGAALYTYGLGHLDDAGLRKRTHYDERWGYPYAYYQPVLSLGRTYGLPLKALNASRELTHAVAEKGITGLSPRLRRQLPKDLDFDDHDHRAEFDRQTADHPKVPGMNLDNFYAAQVVWDETMAENAANWVSARAPMRQLLILAGSAHCRHPAIPSRIERRQPLRVASVRLSAETPADSEGFTYTLVFDGK
ncbi:MAG TPA: ChaN family lipoprotein [Polyangiaceae bacterium]|nr:ChaN family lipoprotein [Polyangiaceae bacterium]